MAGWVAKRYERIPTLITCGVISFAAAFTSCFAQSFSFFIFCRFLLGVSGGISLPIGCSIITEMTPIVDRMVVIAFIVQGGIGFIMGELFAISLAWIYLDNLQQGNWRSYLQTLSMVLFVSVLGIAKFLNDSPRHLIMQDKFEEACNTQQMMCDFNGFEIDSEENFGPNWRVRLKL